MEHCNCHLHNPGSLPLWHQIFQHEGHLLASSEQDNSFHRIFGPGFTYDPQTNMMYTDCEVVDVSCALADGVSVPTPSNLDCCPNLRGFSINICEVQESINHIHTRQPRWQMTLCLICEFHRISESVIMRYWDLAMHEVIEHFKWDGRLTGLQCGMPHPYFIPLDPWYWHTGNRSIANGAGLAAPVNGSMRN